MKAELSRAELRYLRTIEGVICEVHQDREPMMFADLADAEHMWVELHRSFGVPFDECECDILHVENEPGDEDGREDETPLADVKNATRCADGKGKQPR
jgi:hypothetical protein